MTPALRLIALGAMLASAATVLWIAASLEGWSRAIASIIAPMFGGAL